MIWKDSKLKGEEHKSSFGKYSVYWQQQMGFYLSFLHYKAAYEDRSSGFSELKKIKVLTVENPKCFLTAVIHYMKTGIAQHMCSEQNPDLQY